MVHIATTDQTAARDRVFRNLFGGKVLRYEVKPDDTVANGQVFMNAGSDGMRVDQKGSLYTTTEDNVRITSPEGKHLGTIVLPKIPGVRTTNVGFGEADSKTLYITARTHLFRIRLNTPGVRPGPERYTAPAL